MESLLESIVATKSSMVIIDITGVAAVDTEVANRLMLAMKAAKLMGTECILTGISPAISQAIVHLGVVTWQVSLPGQGSGTDWSRPSGS